MNKVLVSLLLTLGLTGFAHAAGNAEAGQGKVVVCGACHGADGNSAAPNFPKLAGQGERYLLKQLKDIKSGARPIVEMTGLLDNLSDQDLQDISAYFASQQMSVGPLTRNWSRGAASCSEVANWMKACRPAPAAIRRMVLAWMPPVTRNWVVSMQPISPSS